jgi:NET1-associated nuclear protein 1 (U3 small nucleolar RNA-associated protein 17)
MADATPLLKRKGEEVAQRKTKKQRKNEAATTPDSKNTPIPKKQSTATPTTNGVSEDATIGTLTVSRLDGTPDLLKAAEAVEPKKKKSKAADVQDAPELSKNALKKKQKKEQKKQDRATRNELLKIQDPASANKAKAKRPESWVTSCVQGGWFLPTDPVFSPDEKYLILANLRSLRIYATDTSLLTNTLPVGEGGVLTAYALSFTNPSQVYIADSTHQLALWDWVSGKNVAKWYPRAIVEHMAVITKPGSDEELLFCVDAGGKDINLRALPIQRKANEPPHSLKQVLETDSTIRSFQVLLQGKYVIAASDDSITFGKRVKISRTELQDFEYVWREFKFSKRVTTFNAYYREPQEIKGKKATQDQRDVIDIAVGDDTGVIILFEDILASFAAVEKGKKTDTAEGLRPKRLHWHRDAVGAVKWSLDGKHYLCPLLIVFANITEETTLFLVVTKPSLRSGNSLPGCHNIYLIFRPQSRMSWSLLQAQRTPCRWLITPSLSFQRLNLRQRRTSLAFNRDESILSKCRSRKRCTSISLALCHWW